MLGLTAEARKTTEMRASSSSLVAGASDERVRAAHVGVGGRLRAALGQHGQRQVGAGRLRVAQRQLDRQPRADAAVDGDQEVAVVARPGAGAFRIATWQGAPPTTCSTIAPADRGPLARADDDEVAAALGLRADRGRDGRCRAPARSRAACSAAEDAHPLELIADAGRARAGGTRGARAATRSAAPRRARSSPAALLLLARPNASGAAASALGPPAGGQQDAHLRRGRRRRSTRRPGCAGPPPRSSGRAASSAAGRPAPGRRSRSPP